MRLVDSAKIRAALKGCETKVLDALGIPWRQGKPHISCPYPDHVDHHPSWRWDARKVRAYCSCHRGGRSVLDVIMHMERMDIGPAMVRAAELLGRADLVRQCYKRKMEGGGGDRPPGQHCNRATAGGCRLAEYSAAKKLPMGFLHSLGLTEIFYQGAPAVRIPYFAADGTETAVRIRVALDGGNRFCWRTGSKSCLYGLDGLHQAIKAGFVLLVEGESDCHTLWLHDIPALGLPGNTNWNEQRDAGLIAGIPVIYLVIEPGQSGDGVMRWLSCSTIAQRTRLVRLSLKDPSALYLANPKTFHATFMRALDEAEPYQAMADRESEAEAARAKNIARDLILEPDILGRFGAEIERAGLAGESRNAKVLYLALTTRLLDRPVNVVVKGPSSGGKNFLVKNAVRFFPPEAYWSRTGMSDRTLAYSDEDFRHRHLVLYEAAGMTSDFATYLIRSLLSEGCIEYEFVEKTSAGLRSRIIKKEGPTGLITTTTAARLHPENETRLLSLTVTDTAAQTKAVMLAQADEAEDARTMDYEPWHAYQLWLASGGPRVVIPFAKALAGEIPAVAVRLRRDFPMLLSLIKAHALLHRERRARDERRQIVATLVDYGTVRELISDLFSEGIQATVKRELRETVEAVQGLAREELSVAEITEALGLDKSSVSRRVKVAISKGYLINLETCKGKRARIALGDPMPDDIEILPHPDKLADRCTVASSTEQIGAPSPPATCNAELAEIEI
jgi:MarR family